MNKKLLSCSVYPNNLRGEAKSLWTQQMYNEKENNKAISKCSLYPNTLIDDNYVKFYEQRLKRGFDDTELYSLDITIARFILPRLKAFKKQYKEIIVDEHGMIKDINKMIKAFELVIKDDGAMLWNDKEIEQYKRGIEAFAKSFLSLWT